jgi:glycosyltransferase involved in cell wall biosynthesis
VNNENLKNIEALSQLVQAKVVVPDRIRDPIFGDVLTNGDKSDLRIKLKRIDFPKHQYMLRSLDLGAKEFRPHILHVEYDLWSPIFWQVALTRRLFAPSAKIFCTIKKNTYRHIAPPIGTAKDWLARRLTRQVDHFFAVNEGVARIYQTRFGADPRKISILQHLGVDTDRFAPITPIRRDPLVIGYCGRIDAGKGIPELVAAVEMLRERGHNVELRLLGSGEQRERLAKQGFPWLTLLPPVPHEEVAAFLQGLDIFVMPARVLPDHEEHDGHAIMEAMACGLPVVGSMSGVIPELIGGGRGRTFTPGDAAALTDAIAGLVADAGLRVEIGKVSRSFALDNFSLARIAAVKAAAYEEALK